MDEPKQSPVRREGRPLPPIDRGMKQPVRRLPPLWRPGVPMVNSPGFRALAPATVPAKPAAVTPPAKVSPAARSSAAALQEKPALPKPQSKLPPAPFSNPAPSKLPPKPALPKPQPKLPPKPFPHPAMSRPAPKVPPSPPPPPAAPPAAASSVARPVAGVVYSRRYKVEQVIGQGGRGTVYKAWDNVLGIHVALKFLPPGVALKPKAVEEIRREAVVTMRLAHENIVRLHNIEMTGHRLFLVMEYVDGENLRQILDRMGPLAPASVVAIARSCASALAYAHRIGVIHRDFKPENVMIDKDSMLKIVDLGTAVMVRSPEKDQYMEGTPGYMSPEQIRGGDTVDARTDVYAFGAVMAELLTGKRAFVYDGDLDHLLDARPRGLESLPPDVRAVLIKAMEPDREARWASALEFCEALAHALQVARPGG